MIEPQVSVVMSVYNGAGELATSLESILQQEGVDLEFIIVDDGSTDESSELLDGYAARDPRIRLIRQPNRGLTSALIRGCGEAKGTYIARQDVGDVSMSGRLKAQKELLDANPNMVLATCWTELVLNDGSTVEVLRPTEDGAELTRSIREDMLGISSHSSVMFRRSAYLRSGGYHPAFYFAQDCDLYLRLAPLGEFGCVPRVFDRCSAEVGGISSSRSKLQAEFARLAQAAYRTRQRGFDDSPYIREAARLREEAQLAREQPASRYAAAGAHFRLGARLERSDRARGRGEYWKAIAICPWYWRAWRRLCL